MHFHYTTSLSGHTSTIECVKFGQCEDIVCAGASSGALKIWDLEAAKIIRTFVGPQGKCKVRRFSSLRRLRSVRLFRQQHKSK
ncbi:hypothetical protein CEXT_422821 [Caerostris extrusa]|uniref:Uncharacterized protein n=1 Tax=Caerostris extrusa TaxID=172846 RepID=A0AAV4V535_CAEEX|nr:hypothetical protein CEXT_422821 [Caerostris extrusa]